MNDRIFSASDYHWSTSHLRNRIKPHFLDFDHYPEPFKAYDAIKKIGFPKAIDPAKKDLIDLFSEIGSGKPGRRFEPASLSKVLFLSYGVTRAETSGKISFFSRTVPSAGGLYPCHIYLIVRHMEGFETGVYYCDMRQESLILIQRGSFSEGDDKTLDISFVITGSFFNSAWKYRERAFRYLLLDSGHLIENLFLALKAEGLCSRADYAFDDDKISALLSLDNEKEVPLACIHSGGKERKPGKRFEGGLNLSGPCSKEIKKERQEISYPILNHIYELGKPGFKNGSVDPESVNVLTLESEGPISFLNFEMVKAPLDYEKAVFSRRSKRNFITEFLDRKKASVLMEAAAGLHPEIGHLSTRARTFLILGVSLQNVEGFDDGFYLFSEGTSSLHMIRNGRFHGPLSRVCLDQQWISNASLNFLFMANLSGLEKAFGPRGYRLILMEAGRIAQRIYLAATGLGLGCCGVGALYDEEAQALFDLNPDSALFYVVAAGRIKGKER